MKHLLGNSKDSGGFIQIPLTLLTLAFTLGAMGTWGLLHHWRHLAETQLRLDQCTAQAASHFKNTLEKTIEDNQRIRELRLAIIAATATPGLIVVPETALYAQVAIQEARLAEWKIKQGLWLARTSCKNLSDRPLPLPSMNWHRKPPDEIGPQEVVWEGPMPAEFRIEIGHSPRHAAARIFQTTPLKGAFFAPTSNWKMEWTSPQGHHGSGLY